MLTLFAVGYSPNKPTVSSVPNSFSKLKSEPDTYGLSYIVRNDTPFLRQHLMAAFAFQMHV